MTTGRSLSTRRAVGGASALVGGALMIASVFLPWLGYPSANSLVTGWDTYTLTSGTTRWFTADAFSPEGFSPGFSGLSVLIVGGLMALLGLALLLLLAVGTRRPGIAVAVGLVLRGLALLIVIVAVTNLASLFATAEPGLVTPQFGLFLLVGGALIGLVSVWVGVSRTRP